MNKQQLIEAIAEQSGITKIDAKKSLEATMDIITKTLTNGESISLVGFGNFTVKERAARMGRNPKTGETIQITASKNPTFKAGKSLKDSVNVSKE